MRLIDADALIEAIWNKHKETEEMFDVCVDELKEVYCGVVASIDEQPTAYDVDAVVKELEEESDFFGGEPMGSLQKAYYCKGVEKAIDIIKAGGAE